MKSKILIIVFSLVAGVVNAQTVTKAVWDYPVKQRSNEWIIMSYDEKIEKSQSPKDILNTWDTETLFEFEKTVNYIKP